MLEVDAAHRLGDFSLDVRFSGGAGVTALFGRSGAGKTLLVNIIAGLIAPQRGRIALGGQVLLDTERGIAVPSHRRRLGYVFQEGRLFPHLTVRQNQLYGRLFAPRNERREHLGPIVELLGIEPLLKRYPHALSGGEKQRVAIGRALLASPRLLLMDEPLASLDDARKAEILPYIERLRDETRIPIVYVSHSLAEVSRLANDIVLLAHGRVAAHGPAAETLARLDLSPLVGRFEAGAILNATVDAHDAAYELTTLRFSGGRLSVPRVAAAIGTPLRVRIRARDVIVGTTRPDGLSVQNVLEGTIAEIGAANGPIVDLKVDVGGDVIVARITRRALDHLQLETGKRVFALIKSIAFGATPSSQLHDAENVPSPYLGRGSRSADSEANYRLPLPL